MTIVLLKLIFENNVFAIKIPANSILQPISEIWRSRNFFTDTTVKVIGFINSGSI